MSRLAFTRALAQGARTAGFRRRGRLPRAIPPKLIESEYARRLLEIVDQTALALGPLLRALPYLTESARAARRIDAGEGDAIRELADQARDALGNAITPGDIRALAIEYGRRTSTWQRVQLVRQTRAALGVDVVSDEGVSAMIEGFVSENVSLIRDLSGSLIGEVEKAATRAVASGTLHRDLAVELEQRLGFARNRARLIARDQVGKLYGQINETRQRATGIDGYIWRTSNDRRVRPAHAAREGERFAWNDPPPDGHPGEPVLCRCNAEPDLSAILES